MTYTYRQAEPGRVRNAPGLRPASCQTTDEALAALADAHRAYLDAKVALHRAVRNAREARATWASIGQVLGVRKQTAQQRFGGLS
jgi:hypothetical protein